MNNVKYKFIEDADNLYHKSGVKLLMTGGNKKNLLIFHFFDYLRFPTIDDCNHSIRDQIRLKINEICKR